MPRWKYNARPSAYACVYCVEHNDQNNQVKVWVFYAIKNSWARWLDYNASSGDFAIPNSQVGRSKQPIGYSIENNPGQPVLPGGRMGCTLVASSPRYWENLYEVNETATESAVRELYEETGLTFNPLVSGSIANPYDCESITEKYFVQDAMTHGIDVVQDITLIPYSFACAYFKLSAAGFDQFMKDAALNVRGNTPEAPKTTDDELSAVLTDYQPEVVSVFENKNVDRKGLRTDWFQAVVVNMPQ